MIKLTPAQVTLIDSMRQKECFLEIKNAGRQSAMAKLMRRKDGSYLNQPVNLKSALNLIESGAVIEVENWPGFYKISEGE